MQRARVQIIENDTLARDALCLYLGKSGEYRIAWSGSFDDFFARTSPVVSELAIVGQPYATRLSTAIEAVYYRFQDDMLAWQQTHEPEQLPHIITLLHKEDPQDIVSLINRFSVKAVVTRQELKRNICGFLKAVRLGKTVFTPLVAQSILMADEKACIQDPYIVTQVDYPKTDSQAYETLVLFVIFGLSREEIQMQLGISEHTVSSRIRSAYQLLGVNNRHDAFLALTQSKDIALFS